MVLQLSLQTHVLSFLKSMYNEKLLSVSFRLYGPCLIITYAFSDTRDIMSRYTCMVPGT